MGVKGKAEACGRCAMSSVVSVASEAGEARNPFDGDAIELPEEQIRAVSRHVVVLGDLKDRLNRWATRVTYGR